MDGRIIGWMSGYTDGGLDERIYGLETVSAEFHLWMVG